jgi:predicted DNA-binding transcriptional regulator YafY
MRRADRLFQIIQILRRTRRLVTADAIAAELEVSRRTVYRDVADLIGQRVPIRGEAGLGYVLEGDFDMPPLMLTPDEIEAAVLGAQWVAGRGDPALAGAARDLIAKIATAVPERLRPFIHEPATGTRPAFNALPDGLDLARTRDWIHTGRKIRLTYRDEAGQTTDRVVWPVIIGYLDAVRMLAAWCETRGDFRHFRTDRVADATFLDERHGCRAGELRARWNRHMAKPRPGSDGARR